MNFREGSLGRRQVVRAVDGIDLEVREGEVLGLVGESGCGKSTLARALLGLVRPSAGRVTFRGRDMAALRPSEMRALRRQVQLVFQDPYASLDARMTVEDIVAEGMDVHHLAKGEERRRRVRRLLTEVGLDPDAGGRYPFQFSGGQRQRIGIARTLAVEPSLLVADEPLSALDVSIRAQILNLLAGLVRDRGLTLVFISHDLAVVRHLCDRVAVMYLGRIVEVAPNRELYAHPQHPYTAALLAAVPVPDPDLEAQRQHTALGGEVPSATHPPPGCRFHTRCPIAQEVCTLDDPALLDHGRAGHEAACHFAEANWSHLHRSIPYPAE